MKIKTDFVTNSSSASFTISLKYLSQCQINLIWDHIEIGMIIAREEGRNEYNHAWQISQNENVIQGSTSMDNFDMLWYLEKIGIRREHIDYEHS